MARVIFQNLGKPHGGLFLALWLLLPVGLVLADAEHVEVVKKFRRAVQEKNAEAIQRWLAPGARVWFEKREGEGRKLDPLGKGPWAAWDEFFRAESVLLLVEPLKDGTVRVKNLENNDWYRLVGRKPVPNHIFYYFDSEGRIVGKLIQAIPGIERLPDRLEEFKAWAEVSRPGLLEELMPEGEIDPALAKAKLWKEALLAWRQDVGLPEVLESGRKPRHRLEDG